MAQTSACKPDIIGADDDSKDDGGKRSGAALSDLRAAVAAVSSSGQIEPKKAEELSKRVDELAKNVTEKSGKDGASTSMILTSAWMNCERKGN